MILSDFEEGERAAFEGTVGSHTRRSTRAGHPFVKADLLIGTGESIRCVWWNASDAPPAGSVVGVRGRVSRYRGTPELHITATQIIGASDSLSFEQRLLHFYIDCLETEQMRELELSLSQRGRRFMLVESGKEELITGDAPVVAFPPDQSRDRWLARRLVAGAAEQVYVGYPLVSATRTDRNRTRHVLSPLFFVQAEVRRATDGSFELAPAKSQPELNEYALEFLGLSREERRGLVETMNEIEEIETATSARALLEAWLEALKSEGLVDDEFELDYDSLVPAGDGLTNTEVLFVAERGAIIRNLTRDLEDLVGLPAERLRQGPLGVLLGGQAQPATMSTISPRPTIVASNIAQDRAISAAMTRPFTVLTGPPGTGKSQVLVNAIAATLTQGERVLFASKNNRAVDVVFERLSGVSDEAYLLRTGNLAMRSQLASQIARVLAKPPQPGEPGTAWEKWQSIVAELRPVYQQVVALESAENELSRAEYEFAVAQRQAPPQALHLEHPHQLYSIADQTHKAILAASHPRPFLPWRKKKWRRSQELRDRWWRYLKTATSTFAILSEHPDIGQVRWCIEIAKSALRVDALRKRVAAANSRLSSLPDYLTISDRLKSIEKRRLDVGLELFRETWRALRASIDDTSMSAAAELAECAAQSSGHRTTARLLKLVPKILPNFPVWGLTTLSARTSLPLSSDLFDLLIIDEASQCDIASAIPLLYRARRVLIIGDPKQLIHVTSLTEAVERQIADRWGLDDTSAAFFSYKSRSLFRLASSRVGNQPLFLDQHFRSHPAIITFANDHFYGGNLLIMTEPTDATGGRAVEWKEVVGQFERGPKGRSVISRKEAEAVVETLEMLKPELLHNSWSVGVVTPFRAQADLIAELLIDPPDSLAVATAHRFQGDERDIMIFSPGVSSGMPAHLSKFASDPNLLNVAITRARKRLLIVGDAGFCRQLGGPLQQLANYVWDLEHSPFRSPLERRLYEALSAAGVPVQAAVEAEGYVLDIAVITPSIRIDIECDGARWHMDQRADAIRDTRLREAGWVVMRFSGVEIQRNLEGCVEHVRRLLETHPL